MKSISSRWPTASAMFVFVSVWNPSFAAATSYRPTESGNQVGGIYQRRLGLSSGRFAMLDDGLGFSLVPWSPSLERQLGRHVAGIARSDGGVDWTFGRNRGLGL